MRMTIAVISLTVGAMLGIGTVAVHHSAPELRPVAASSTPETHSAHLSADISMYAPDTVTFSGVLAGTAVAEDHIDAWLEDDAGGLVHNEGDNELIQVGSYGYEFEWDNDGGACGPAAVTCWTLYDLNSGLCVTAEPPGDGHSSWMAYETGCAGGGDAQEFTSPGTGGYMYSELAYEDSTVSCLDADSSNNDVYIEVQSFCTSQGYYGMWNVEG